MSGHTPGPWRCDVMTREVSVTAPCGRVLWVHGTDVDGCVVPDARLIAAAPELLEALVLAENIILQESGGEYCIAEDMIRAAIAKATGEQP